MTKQDKALISELVEALEGMLGHAGVSDVYGSDIDEEDHGRERKARAALSKVKGWCRMNDEAYSPNVRAIQQRLRSPFSDIVDGKVSDPTRHYEALRHEAANVIDELVEALEKASGLLDQCDKTFEEEFGNINPWQEFPDGEVICAALSKVKGGGR